MKRKNYQVEGLRGIAIILVLVFHFFYRFEELYNIESKLQFASRFGEIGVTLFLLITGYYFPTAENRPGIREWILKRAKRLYPMYFISIVFIFVWLFLFPLPGRETSIVDLLLNITLINGFIGTPYVDGAHWYITTLISCLVGYSFCLMISKRSRMLLICVTLWVLIASVLGVVKNCQVSQYNKVLSAVYHVMGGNYLFVVLFALSLKMVTLENKRLYMIPAVFCLIGCYINSGLVSLGILLLCTIILMLAVSLRLSILSNRLFTIVGESSYCIYLFHQNIGYSLMYNISRVSNTFNLVYPTLTLMLFVIVGCFVHFKLETKIVSYNH